MFDHELAIRWTQEEQEKYIVDERAKLLAEYFENRKKQLAEERAAAIRNKPPTKSQLRSLMMTYLKHTGRYKHAQLNKKTLEEIQVLYIKEQERIADFVPIGSEEDERLIQKMNKKVAGVHEEKVLEEPDSTKVEVKQEGNKESTRKRPGRRLKMKATKKSRMQKTDSDLEEEEHLKTFLKLVPDEEGIIDYEVLEKRFPIINWESKFYHLDRHGAECIYYRIFRSDESSRWIKTFSEMVKMFDRLDLEELYNLVMQRFESTTPEGVDLVLWGDLRTMFDANTEDELWQNQERWNLKSWNFYENCGVHTLTLEDGTEIHMLVERKYPLTKETLERMMSLKLITKSASESAYNLLSKELASPKQMALGKDISNPLIVDSLLKTIWLSMHHVIAIKHWLFQSKRLLIYSMAGEDEFHDDNLPPPVTPTKQTPHTLSTIKLPILKKGKWSSTSLNRYNRQIRVLPPKTAEEILARERERKARTTLLMSIPEDHLAKFHKMTDAKDMWEAIKSRFGGNDESKKMQKYILKPQFESFSVSPLKMTIRSFLGLYLLPGPKVFESDIKGSIASSSSTQNVAFVSSESTKSTNDVSTAYGVSTSSGHNSQKEGSSSYTDELKYSFFTNQLSGPQLDHEDLEQVDEFDLEEMDLKWQVAMISIRLKKFYKKTWRRLQECKSKGNQESRRRDAWNTGYKAKDNRMRLGKQEEPKALVTLDGDGVDWIGHAEDEQENFAKVSTSQ
ncbi:hypothetical protein Tco_1276062 [Tanacetum coccineum]